ncbi:hypothetical protein MSAN_00207800 [Mycena sanguinolenta]|uniref:DUF6534 domain-containing protein n=1 Tax=Mycena sanguinolenta TaxID=230812 RepID=A0A8H6ZF40_9AGAR|nr:hypothetical protein MSAN_00207800 [Mycena sanguinolenta]
MDKDVLNSTLGALEIGILVSYMLFGVTTTQTYIYYNRFPDDSLKLKALVAFVLICESGHAICIGHGLYTYTIMDYGHPERIAAALPKSFLVGAFFSNAVSACVQGFFIFRANVLTKKPYIFFIISGMMFLRLLANSAVYSLAFGMTLLVPFEKQWGWLLIAGLIISTTVDVAIAAILVVSLRIQSRGVRKRTAALVDRLIAWTIETALITSMSTIVTFICFITMEHSFVWLAIFTVSTRRDIFKLITG